MLNLRFSKYLGSLGSPHRKGNEMELKKFVKAYMEATGNKTGLDDMLNKIQEEARKRAVKGCAVLSEEDVEKIIDGYKLEPIPATEKAEKVETNKQTARPQKVARKPETKPEKENEQMSLFDFQL